MGLAFRKRIDVGDQTAVNVSKGGASLSKKVGPVTVNSRGRVTVRLAKGLSYRSRWK